jgi:hypothetical protein
MFKKFGNWLNTNVYKIVGTLIVFGSCFIVYNLIDVTRKPPVIEVTKGSVQNHLVWAANGKCYFVRPYSNETVYLIPVDDCDKR